MTGLRYLFGDFFAARFEGFAEELVAGTTLCGPLLGPSRSYNLARLGAPLLRSQLCPAGLTSVRLDHL